MRNTILSSDETSLTERCENTKRGKDAAGKKITQRPNNYLIFLQITNLLLKVPSISPSHQGLNIPSLSTQRFIAQ